MGYKIRLFFKQGHHFTVKYIHTFHVETNIRANLLLGRSAIHRQKQYTPVDDFTHISRQNPEKLIYSIQTTLDNCANNKNSISEFFPYLNSGTINNGQVKSRTLLKNTDPNWTHLQNMTYLSRP